MADISMFSAFSAFSGGVCGVSGAFEVFEVFRFFEVFEVFWFFEVFEDLGTGVDALLGRFLLVVPASGILNLGPAVPDTVRLLV
jgi:hypothetical protein